MADVAERIAVLGAGLMGSAMAGRLRQVGHVVTVWDRSAAKAEALRPAGVEPSATPADAAAKARFVLTMLSDAAAVEEVMAGEHGALDAMGAGSIWLQMSTVGVAGTDRLGGLAAGRGIAYVDAPVSGTRQPAERGELTIFASGHESLQDTCAGVFSALGSRTLWVGDVGAGTRLKLVVNHWLLTLVATLADTMALAEALGLDPAVLQEVLPGRLAPPFIEPKAASMLAHSYPPAFPLRLADKDAQLVLEAARDAGARTDLAEAVARCYAQALAGERGEQDFAAVFEARRSAD